MRLSLNTRNGTRSLKAAVTGRWHDNRHALITDLAERGAGDQTNRLQILQNLRRRQRMTRQCPAMLSRLKEDPCKSPCNRVKLRVGGGIGRPVHCRGESGAASILYAVNPSERQFKAKIVMVVSWLCRLDSHAFSSRRRSHSPVILASCSDNVSNSSTTRHYFSARLRGTEEDQPKPVSSPGQASEHRTEFNKNTECLGGGEIEIALRRQSREWC